MECKDAIARLEFGNVLADLVHDAGDVVARISGLAHPLRQFPVFRVGAAHDDFDDELVVIGSRNGRVCDGHAGSGGDNGFFHFSLYTFSPL